MSPKFSSRPTRRAASRRTAHPGTAGFSLTELLVVIAIIGLLMAIIFPLISNARLSAKDGVCRSNLRQFQMANLLHAAEQNGYYFYPNGNSSTPSHSQGWWITQEIFAYYIDAVQKPTGQSRKGVVESLKCPADELTKIKSSAYERTQFPGYGYHKFFDTGSERLHQNDVRYPSQLFAFADALDFWMNKVPPATNYDWKNENRHAVTISYRHRNGANVVFFDGHSKYLRRDEIEPQASFPRLWKLNP